MFFNQCLLLIYTIICSFYSAEIVMLTIQFRETGNHWGSISGRLMEAEMERMIEGGREQES